MVSHDVEFCARYAHRCALFFDGAVVTEATSRAFFSGNSFYTTAANRIARPLEPQAVTAEDVMAICGGNVPPLPELPRSCTISCCRNFCRRRARCSGRAGPFWWTGRR